MTIEKIHPVPSKKAVNVALFPDVFAHYRYSLFRKLSEPTGGLFSLTIYADNRETIQGLKLANLDYCNDDISSGGVRWRLVKNRHIGRFCLWQSKLIKNSLFGRHDVLVYWGEVHRVSTWLGMILAKLCGKKVVLWGHGLYGQESWLLKTARVIFHKWADATLLYGKHAEGLLLKSGISPENLFVINNSLDITSQNLLFEAQQRVSEGKNLPFNKGEKILIFVGRLTVQKKLDMLIHALNLVNQNYPRGFKCIFVGDGSERVVLEKLTCELGIEDSVFFYGSCYDESELANLIVNSTICVSPGEVGLTAMHSLVYGTPVITHNNFSRQMPEAEAIVEGSSGLFFEYDNVSDLAEKILRCNDLIEEEQITAKSCRTPILKFYTPDFQREVFSSCIRSVISR